MALSGADEFSPIIWTGSSVRLIDQTRLPMEEVWVETSDYREVVGAIRGMMVRGAPAIGIAGAYGLALAAMELSRTANGGWRVPPPVIKVSGDSHDNPEGKQHETAYPGAGPGLGQVVLEGMHELMPKEVVGVSVRPCERHDHPILE